VTLPKLTLFWNYYIDLHINNKITYIYLLRILKSPFYCFISHLQTTVIPPNFPSSTLAAVAPRVGNLPTSRLIFLCLQQRLAGCVTDPSARMQIGRQCECWLLSFRIGIVFFAIFKRVIAKDVPCFILSIVQVTTTRTVMIRGIWNYRKLWDSGGPQLLDRWLYATLCVGMASKLFVGTRNVVNWARLWLSFSGTWLARSSRNEQTIDWSIYNYIPIDPVRIYYNQWV